MRYDLFASVSLGKLALDWHCPGVPVDDNFSYALRTVVFPATIHAINDQLPGGPPGASILLSWPIAVVLLEELRALDLAGRDAT